jgi:hypothetical protein
MANEAAVTQTINIVPVQGIFEPEPTFDLVTLIGPAGTPFFAKIDPNQSGLNITNSTINSTTIGATTPSTGVFTNIATTTGTISSVPSGPTSIVNQAYVDAIAQGLAFKAPANYTTTGNITLSGLAVQAGGDWNATLTAGNRILVKDQTAGANNGIYLAAAGAWTRSLDANTYDELLSAYLFVLDGVTLAGSAWVNTNLPGGTLGVTAITFVRFSNTAVYSAGTGLTLTNYVFSITPVGTAGTYGSASAVPVFVTNASGQVTSVTNTSIAINGNQITSGTIGSSYLSGSYTGITGVGTLTAGTWNATAIGAAYGGTGLTGYTTGDLLVASGATALTTLSDVATGNALISGGVGLPPFYGKIGLTTHVSGTLPIANGGTNGTATPTAGAVAYGTGTAYAFTLAGTTGQVLTSNGAGTPSWTTIGGGDVTGPSSSTDNAIARFDGVTGKIIQNSVTTIDDTGNASGILSQQFSNGSAVTVAAGKMWYDGSTGAWNLGMGNGNITQQVGEELFTYGKASAAITDSPLQIVYHTGTVGSSGVVTFAPTIAGITNANDIIGVATESLALNGFGRITVFGVVRGITTNGTAFGETWADDDVIWYNPVTGNPTKVEPVAPYIKVQVGTVITAGSGGSGSFQVNVVRGSTLGGTDSNVQFGTLANNNLIQYSTSLGYWTNVAASGVTVGTATNLAGGGAGSIPYQSGAGATAFLAFGTSGQVLTSNGTSAPSWSTPASYATVTDDTTTNATRYPLYANQTTGNLTTEFVSSTKLQFNPSTGVFTSTSFSGAGTGLTGTATSLSIGGNAATATSATSATTATNIAGGVANQIPFQTGAGATSFIVAPTTASTALTWSGSAFTWATGGSSVTISDDTTTNATRYPLFADATTGTVSTTYVSSTKLQYNPSKGELSAPAQISSNGIVINSQTVSANYTIAAGNNGLSAGTVSVNTGITVTVSTGSVWTVV